MVRIAYLNRKFIKVIQKATKSRFGARLSTISTDGRIGMTIIRRGCTW